MLKLISKNVFSYFRNDFLALILITFENYMNN